ncbi:2-haloacid dehalogenase [Alicyclobacillus sacchari]|uniref:2-haloacid dehalogenase n=1 Tax=Alicyclobacillus sacchari TaxID=392010 RepID=A0A4R8LQ49_9BACL|nr:haloacid dehalogenase type II [Alicyclobacillus sacchari]TDY47970.1 2-haloacid dehalogenase [Alicyclobacillus sacchari]GMA56090.1 haloacid dehalogenase [Alicyclobacillus sacchari]
MAVVVFDAYGTLFDLNGLADIARPLFDSQLAARAFCRRWRQLHLEFAWQAALVEQYRDFDQLAKQALDAAVAEHNLVHPHVDVIAADLLKSMQTLPVYPDVKPMLEELTTYRLAILSNGTLRALQASAVANDVLFSFDFILSVDPVRTYKPSRKAYALAQSAFGIEKRDILFVSSNSWDVAGAKAYGFRTCWCNRTKSPYLSPGQRPDYMIATLSELPAILSECIR